MTQITNGIRKILNYPSIYSLIQNVMGARKFRKWFVNKYLNKNRVIRILDIGCGTADILEFIDCNHIYSGFDMSNEYIESAIKRYGNRGSFECGLVTEQSFDEGSTFDVVLVLGVLHHLEDEEVLSLCSLALKHLKKGGELITVDPCFVEGQSRIARYLISKDRGQNVRDQYGYLSLLKSSFVHVDSTIRHQKWIPYTHCINICTK